MLTQPDVSYYIYVYVYIANTEKSSIKWLVQISVNKNFRPVVMNYRGRGGIPLKVLSNELSF